jgi:hypothetical protein
MRNVYVALFVALLTIGCEKDRIRNTSGDFLIDVYREFPNGQNSRDVERALNLDDAADLSAVVQIKEQNLVIRLGGVKVNTVDPKMGLQILFLGQQDPAKIAGTYNFPDAADKVDVHFFEYGLNSFTRTSSPASGTVEVSYDPSLNRWSGKVKKLKYNLLLNSPYTYQEINADFTQVPFR